MAEFLLLMHDDCATPAPQQNWPPYLEKLATAGVLRGGSAMGSGLCVRRAGNTPDLSRQLVGYIKIEARDLSHARELVHGNPTYEAGGTVEIRELPMTD